MQTCFGLFAIRRADTTNDAIFDPDSALYVRLGALVIERNVVRLKSHHSNLFRLKAKKKVRFSTNLCVRAIRKIFLRECLRDLNFTSFE